MWVRWDRVWAPHQDIFRKLCEPHCFKDKRRRTIDLKGKNPERAISLRKRFANWHKIPPKIRKPAGLIKGFQKKLLGQFAQQPKWSLALFFAMQKHMHWRPTTLRQRASRVGAHLAAGSHRRTAVSSFLPRIDLIPDVPWLGLIQRLSQARRLSFGSRRAPVRILQQAETRVDLGAMMTTNLSEHSALTIRKAVANGSRFG
jgi:hypothetical protein